MSYTPGPWKVTYTCVGNEPHNIGTLVTTIKGGAIGGFTIAQFNQHVAGRTYPELLANAQLLAAAPALLEACKLAMALLVTAPDEILDPDEIADVQAALVTAVKKAQGD